MRETACDVGRRQEIAESILKDSRCDSLEKKKFIRREVTQSEPSDSCCTGSLKGIKESYVFPCKLALTQVPLPCVVVDIKKHPQGLWHYTHTV